MGIKTKLTGILFALGLSLAAVSNCSDSVTTGDMPQNVYNFCLEYSETLCKTMFDCEPTLAAVYFKASDDSVCAEEAEKACTGEGEGNLEDDCNDPNWPSQSQMDSCGTAMKAMECEDFGELEDDFFPECAFIDEICPEDEDPDAGGPDPDAGGPDPDSGDPKTDTTVDKGDTPTHDTTVDTGDTPVPDTEPQGNCPYTTNNFSCATACDNLWDLAEKCADDQTIPTNLKTVLTLMTEAGNKTMAVAGCKIGCESSYATYEAQWKCFF